MTRTTTVQVGAALAALALVSMMTLRASSAVFTGTTENPGNAWDAGTVTLTDNKTGTALFASTDMVPGDTDTTCIEVTYTGSVAATTAMYVSAFTDSDGSGTDTGTAAELSDDLDVTVDMGAAGITCGLPWTGVGATNLATATTLKTMPATFVAGGTTWAPTSTTDMFRAFNITVTLNTNAADDAQGDGATATFTWEAQNS